jgi:smad nuclear-interacting protein 1
MPSILDRHVQEKDEFGGSKGVIKSVSSCINSVDIIDIRAPISRPFIIDLESTNGTHVNDDKIPTSRYYELKASDGK